MVYVAVGVVVLLALMLRFGLARVTVFEYERGLRYRCGRFVGILLPGMHWFIPFCTTVRKLDMRQRNVAVGGQEVLSADGVTIKVTLAASYEILDPATAVNTVQDYAESLYLELQLALRELVGAMEIDALLRGRADLAAQLAARATPQAEKLGVRLVAVSIKDVMFPGKLKEIFAQVVAARQEGLAALERARGETAALRHLANAARQLEGNPALMQLRLLQTVGGSSGNTLVFSPVAGNVMTVPVARPPQDLDATRASGGAAGAAEETP